MTKGKKYAARGAVFIFGLLAVLLAQGDSAALTVGSATVTITSTSPATLNFPLTRSGEVNDEAWVGYQTQDSSAHAGTDYVATSGMAVVAAGTFGSTIPVTVNGRSTNVPDKNLILQVLGATGVGPRPVFGAAQSVPVGSGPQWPLAVDLNGDGKPDLVVADGGNNDITVLLNTTAPGATAFTFAPPLGFPVGSNPQYVAAADVNGDGRPDLIVANISSNNISVLINNTAPGGTTASFFPQQTFATGIGPVWVSAADLNGDGLPELLVSNDFDNSITLLLNTTPRGSGSPSFYSPFNLSAPSPAGLALADVDGDGRLDVVVADLGANTVSVFPNTSSAGSFTPAFGSRLSFAASAPLGLAVSDVNGDGRPDVVVANNGANTVSVLLNTSAAGATPAFGAPKVVASGQQWPFFSVADVNGDGKPDVLLASIMGSGAGGVSVLRNVTVPGSATPAFTETDMALGNATVGTAAADLNGDGKPDLVAVGGSGNAWVLLNATPDDSAVFGLRMAGGLNTGVNPIGLVQADFNGDGKPDLAAANFGGNSVSVAFNTTAPGAQTTSFGSVANFNTGPQPRSVAVGDFNGDGKPDLVTANMQNGSVSILLNTTAPGAALPSFSPAFSFGSGGGTPTFIGVGDFNNDGRPDLAVSNRTGQVRVLLNSTTPGANAVTFVAAAGPANGVNDPVNLALLDYNGDGRLDLVSADYNGGDTNWFLNNTGPGMPAVVFQSGWSQAVTFGLSCAAVADFNGDGRPDLGIVNQTGAPFSFLTNNTPTGASTPQLSQSSGPSLSYGPAGGDVTADFNGDGKPDLAAAMYQSNNLLVLLNTTTPGAAAPAFSVGPVVSSNGATPQVPVVADFNGDGKPDLAVTNQGSNTVVVLLNTQHLVSVNSFATGTIHYNVPAPTATLSPSSLAFGNVVQNQASTAQAVTLSNNGNATLNVSGISFTGANAGDFAQTGNCASSLAPGASCTINVVFTPAATGSRAALLSVASNAPGSPATISVGGTGVAPNPSISPSPASLGFGNQPVNTAASAQTVTVTNNGNVSLKVTGATASGTNATDFSVGSNNCGTLAPQATCTISFSFTPGAAGNRSATETINTDQSGVSAAVAVSGTGTQPGVGLSPASLSFAGQVVGTASAAQTITLSNSGNSSLTITSIAAGGEFAQSNDCPAVLAAAASCSVSIVFTPSATGSRSGSLSILSNAPTSPDSAALSGTGIQAAFSSASSLSFASQVVGSTSSAQTLTITNSGTSALSVGTPALSGSNAADYAVAGNTCTAAVAPNASCTVSVSFTPSATGARSATLSVPSNAPSSPNAVSLSGNGIQAALSAPASASFADQVVGSSSAAQGVTITNSGSATLNIGSVSASGDFAVSSNGCSAGVAPNATCSIGLTFTPTATGARSGTLSIASNDPHSPAALALSGTGIQAAFSSASSLNFASQVVGSTSAAQTLTISNSGTATLDVGSPVLSGANATDYAISGNTCTAGVAPNASCAVSVSFTPSATGLRSATLSVSSNAPSSPNAVSLSGTGIQAALSAPASAGFADQVVGSSSAAQSITITNSGTATLDVGSVGASGDFAVSSNGCTTGLAPNATCSIGLTFTPTAIGARSGALSIASNDPHSPASVALSGSGIQAAFSSVSSVSFANQVVGSTSAAQTLTISNSGSAPLTVGTPALSGANAADYAISGNTCTAAVAPNASCSISLSFTPSATGARSATLSVPSNAPSSPNAVSLSGSGIQAALSAPASASFADQVVGSASAAQSITITNSGTATLDVGSVGASGDFAVSSNGCNGGVAPNATCSIGVTFTPAATGARSGTLSIASNDPHSPASVALSGNGIQAAFSSASSVSFASQVVGSTSSAESLTISNSGSAPLTVGTPALSGANAADYAVSGNTCTAAVAPNASCSVSLSFTPAATGARSATLSVPSNAPSSPNAVSLSGNGIQAALSAPASASFADQVVGSASAAQSITITNSGTATLDVGSVGASGDFAVSSNGCTTGLAPNATCSIGLTFTPTAIGARSGALSIASNDPHSPASVALSGSGIQAAFSSVSSVSFANQVVGSTSAAQTLTISNSGSAPLTVGTPALSGANAADYAISGNTCTAAVAPNASCSVSLSFTPSATAARSATLSVPSNAPSSPNAVSLSGNGIQAALSAPASASFTDQVVGSASTAQSITVANSGTATLNVSSVSASGDFAVSSNGCTTGLAPNATCSIGLTFTPTATGARSGTLSIASNDPHSPASVALSGNGVQAALSSASSLGFASQVVGSSSAAQALVVTNTGTASLSVGTPALSGANAGDYAVSANGCGSSVAPNASCSISLVFTPSATGTRSATLLLPSNAPGSPKAVSLSGSGIQAALSAPSALAFGSLPLGSNSTQSLTVSNSGSATLSVGTPSLSGTNAADYAIVSNGCTSSLAPGAGCSISLSFTPGATGGRSATLSIPSNAPGSPAVVALSGTGTQPVAGLSTHALSFGNQAIGSSSAAQGVTITNTGTAPLSVGSPSLSGANPGDYLISGNTCTAAVAPNASCAVSISFKPTANAARSATLSIPSNAPSSPDQVSLSGFGLTAGKAVVSLNPSSLAFGGQKNGTTSAPHTVTLSNYGALSLTIKSIATTSPLFATFAQTNNCPAALAPAAACTISVTFKPATSGAKSGTLTITTNASSSPDKLSLTGTGQ